MRQSLGAFLKKRCKDTIVFRFYKIFSLIFIRKVILEFNCTIKIEKLNLSIKIFTTLYSLSCWRGLG